MLDHPRVFIIREIGWSRQNVLSDHVDTELCNIIEVSLQER